MCSCKCRNSVTRSWSYWRWHQLQVCHYQPNTCKERQMGVWDYDLHKTERSQTGCKGKSLVAVTCMNVKRKFVGKYETSLEDDGWCQYFVLVVVSCTYIYWRLNYRILYSSDMFNSVQQADYGCSRSSWCFGGNNGASSVKSKNDEEE